MELTLANQQLTSAYAMTVAAIQSNIQSVQAIMDQLQACKLYFPLPSKRPRRPGQSEEDESFDTKSIVVAQLSKRWSDSSVPTLVAPVVVAIHLQRHNGFIQTPNQIPPACRYLETSRVPIGCTLRDDMDSREAMIQTRMLILLTNKLIAAARRDRPHCIPPDHQPYQ